MTLVSSQLKKYSHKSYELLRIRGGEPKKEDLDSEDVEEEPTHVDLIYYCGQFEWDEDFGGLTIYNDAHGEQVFET